MNSYITSLQRLSRYCLLSTYLLIKSQNLRLSGCKTMATITEAEKKDKTRPGVGYITADGFPAAGLRRTVRHITGHNTEGKGIFLSTDCGDHHRVMGEQEAIANILYSTRECPVEMGGDIDVVKAKEAEVSIT